MKPILFNYDMVRAILDGRKTVTRRVIKDVPENVYAGCCVMGAGLFCEVTRKVVRLSPYRAGDILYVRETWSPVFVRPKRYLYKADSDSGAGEGAGLPIRWHPSIHMPKEAARIFLRVLSVRVEKLQDITINGLQDEGIIPQGYISQYAAMGSQQYFDEFKRLWDSTIPNHPNKFKRYPYYWADNPWVWVIEFERCERPEV